MDAMVGTRSAGFHNKTDLNRFIKNHDGAAPDDLVKAINIKLNLSVSADNAGIHHRLDAGRMLLELRTLIEADGGDWWKWQKGKFDRSRKDMEKIMRMARADEPEAAAEGERAQTRERMNAHRTMERTVRSKTEPTMSAAPAVAVDIIENALRLVRQMTVNQRHEFMAKLKEEFP